MGVTGRDVLCHTCPATIPQCFCLKILTFFGSYISLRKGITKKTIICIMTDQCKFFSNCEQKWWEPRLRTKAKKRQRDICQQGKQVSPSLADCSRKGREQCPRCKTWKKHQKDEHVYLKGGISFHKRGSIRKRNHYVQPDRQQLQGNARGGHSGFQNRVTRSTSLQDPTRVRLMLWRPASLWIPPPLSFSGWRYSLPSFKSSSAPRRSAGANGWFLYSYTLASRPDT